MLTMFLYNVYHVSWDKKTFPDSCKWKHLCATVALHYNGSPSEGLHILHRHAKLQNVISLV